MNEHPTMPSRPQSGLTVLGIETSCDETAAAVVRRGADGTGTLLGNVIRAQWEAHKAYGGVVPEIAARAHVEIADDVVALALEEAGAAFADLDGVAVTAGPGLIGGVLVGLMTAKAIALAHNIPLIAINHLEGHALTVGLTDALRPPYLLLLVSGGHTQTLIVRGVGGYERVGTTIDDALGEAFDKTAKLLGLGFPGGPAVEQAAALADGARAAAIDLPAPMVGRPDANFSFSGLKTAVRRHAERLSPLADDDVNALCAAFQTAVVSSLCDRVRRAMEIYDDRVPCDAKTLVVAGGVAANQCIRRALTALAQDNAYRLVVAPPALCTDNAAMIAWAGAERFARGESHGLDVPARARWPLDEAAAPAVGYGRKGAKA